MTFVNYSRIVFKMATNGVHSRTSDFSIDHILNRAGDRFVVEKRNDFETNSLKSSASTSEDESCENYGRVQYRNEFLERENSTFIQIPTFDWLNYTRYNMPRISRKIFLKTLKIFEHFTQIKSKVKN